MIAGQTKVGGEQRGNLVGKQGGVSPMPITFLCHEKLGLPSPTGSYDGYERKWLNRSKNG
jgi:hypothetical protein